MNLLLIIPVVIFLMFGVRIVRPTHKAIIETLGKFTKVKEAGFIWIVPLIQSAHYVNITEQMIDTRKQNVVTQDNLNAVVDAVIYYKVLDVKKSLYNVDQHKEQLGSLTRTTLRNVIGNLSYSAANSERDLINKKVEEVLSKETSTYGLDVLRVELQRVEAPDNVQEAMNDVVIAERQKIAEKDKAEAEVINAEGLRRSAIQRAEGDKKSRILSAEGKATARTLEAEAKAKAIKLENEAAEKYFKGNAQILKQLEVTAESLRDNTKVVVPTDGELVNVIGDLSGITPIERGKKK